MVRDILKYQKNQSVLSATAVLVQFGVWNQDAVNHFSRISCIQSHLLAGQEILPFPILEPGILAL